MYSLLSPEESERGGWRLVRHAQGERAREERSAWSSSELRAVPFSGVWGTAPTGGSGDRPRLAALRGGCRGFPTTCGAALPRRRAVLCVLRVAGLLAAAEIGGRGAAAARSQRPRGVWYSRPSSPLPPVLQGGGGASRGRCSGGRHPRATGRAASGSQAERTEGGGVACRSAFGGRASGVMVLSSCVGVRRWCGGASWSCVGVRLWCGGACFSCVGADLRVAGVIGRGAGGTGRLAGALVGVVSAAGRVVSWSVCAWIGRWWAVELVRLLGGAIRSGFAMGLVGWWTTVFA